MLSQTEKSIHLSEKCTEKQDRMSMMTDPTGHNTTENRVWDGMAYRILPTIPKSREEVHNNILIALSGTWMSDIFQYLTILTNANKNTSFLPSES